jgi:hypothetical protein
MLPVAPRLEPGHPSRPPRAITGGGAGEPGVGIDVAFPAVASGHDVMAPVMTRLRHDPGIVPAIGEQEGEVIIGEELQLVDRAPRRDVIGLGADHEHRGVERTVQSERRDSPPPGRSRSACRETSRVRPSRTKRHRSLAAKCLGSFSPSWRGRRGPSSRRRVGASRRLPRTVQASPVPRRLARLGPA